MVFSFPLGFGKELERARHMAGASFNAEWGQCPSFPIISSMLCILDLKGPEVKDLESVGDP
ncbi:MAG: hypothetical protein LBE27_04490 [Deltaproteobacteria bacterium]|jgi:hypothetical protein|nr:hypothetical protein [Deltaproteobacteria bacterium]